ncbi:hypothetical protein [Streptomyces aureoversilis]|uniref:Uncharacterized protein n=1 Tax=Streptomyces aureoversilis TaxID=67277 RepID=A0ABW0AAM0_9ACTN
MADLPDPHFRELIHPYTGDVADARVSSHGFSSDFTAVITSEQGVFFARPCSTSPEADGIPLSGKS